MRPFRSRSGKVNVFNRVAEDLEPEALEQAKQEDKKLERGAEAPARD